METKHELKGLENIQKENNVSQNHYIIINLTLCTLSLTWQISSFLNLTCLFVFFIQTFKQKMAKLTGPNLFVGNHKTHRRFIKMCIAFSTNEKIRTNEIVNKKRGGVKTSPKKLVL